MKSEDLAIVKVACALLQLRFTNGQNEIREHQKFQADLKTFLTSRTHRFKNIATEINVDLLADIEGLPANNERVMKDVTASLRKLFSETGFSSCHAKQQGAYLDQLRILTTLTQYFADNKIEPFLCDESLRLAVVSGIIFDDSLSVNLGVSSSIVKFSHHSLPTGWAFKRLDQEKDITLYNHKNGMTVKVWRHRKTKNSVIRANRHLVWRYSPFKLSHVLLSGHSFLRPCNSYISDEFGTITTLDRVFHRNELEAENVSLRRNTNGGFKFLAEQLCIALNHSDRGTARLIADLLRKVYSISYDNFFPETHRVEGAIVRNSSTGFKVEPTELNEGRILIEEAIAEKLKIFSVKETPSDGDSFWIALMDLKNVLSKGEVSFFLIGGTLLGAVRDGDFIRSDYDIDIGVFQKDVDAFTLCDLFVNTALFEVKDYVSKHLVKVVHNNGVEIDIFIHDEINGRLRHKGRVHEWFNDRFEIAEIDLLGEAFGVPQDYEKWLDENYGHWKYPVVFYDVSYDTPNRVFVKNRSDGLYHLKWQIEKSLKRGDKSSFYLAVKALKDSFDIDINLLVKSLAFDNNEIF